MSRKSQVPVGVAPPAPAVAPLMSQYLSAAKPGPRTSQQSSVQAVLSSYLRNLEWLTKNQIPVRLRTFCALGHPSVNIVTSYNPSTRFQKKPHFFSSHLRTPRSAAAQLAAIPGSSSLRRFDYIDAIQLHLWRRVHACPTQAKSIPPAKGRGNIRRTSRPAAAAPSRGRPRADSARDLCGLLARHERRDAVGR